MDNAPAGCGNERQTALVCSQGGPRVDLIQMLPGEPGGWRQALDGPVSAMGRGNEEIT